MTACGSDADDGSCISRDLEIPYLALGCNGDCGPKGVPVRRSAASQRAVGFVFYRFPRVGGFLLAQLFFWRLLTGMRPDKF